MCSWPHVPFNQTNPSPLSEHRVQTRSWVAFPALRVPFIPHRAQGVHAAIVAVRYVPRGHSAQAASSAGPPEYTMAWPGGQSLLWGVQDMFPPRENFPPGQSVQLKFESCACPGGQAGSVIQWHAASASLRAYCPRGHSLQRLSVMLFPRYVYTCPGTLQIVNGVHRGALVRVENDPFAHGEHARSTRLLPFVLTNSPGTHGAVQFVQLMPSGV